MVDDTKIEVIEEVVQPTEPVAVPTEDELKAKLNEALKTGDFKAIAKVAAEIAKLQKSNEQAELDAKLAVLKGTTEKVKAAIMKVITPMMNSGDLDKADGVWFSYDFGETGNTCRLTKGTTRKASSGTGGGTGKKFDVTTNALLEQFGNEEFKDGISFNAAHESSTDGNYRYNIRQKLLKKGGYIS